MSRCTGHCCREFSIAMDGVKQVMLAPESVQDGEQIASMLVFVRWAEPGDTLPSGRIVPPDHPHQPIFSCANFDRASGDCRIYEQRPSMCREYPYGRRCEMLGCTHPRPDGRTHLSVIGDRTS